MNLNNTKTTNKFSRGEQWKVEPLDKKDSGRSIYRPGSFETIETYCIAPLNRRESHPQHYDPLVDTPKAYLKFMKLADYERSHWDAKHCTKEILAFFHEFGPPWPLWYSKGGPFLQMTIKNVFGEARVIAKAVRTYKILTDVRNGEKLLPELKEYMINLHETEIYRDPVLNYQLRVTPTGVVTSHFFVKKDDERFTPTIPNTEYEVISAATAYVIGSVNLGFTGHPVGLGLTCRTSKSKDIIQDSSWAPSYRFTSLLSALWLQFYLDILNQSQLRECNNERCKSLFVINRADQEYCSYQCRSAQKMRRRYHSKKSSKEAHNERLHSQKE